MFKTETITLIGRLLMIVTIILFTACASHQKKQLSGADEELIVYPSPPDTARIQYLTYFSGSVNLKKQKATFKDFILGKKEVSKSIGKPYGVFIHNGKIYVCDQLAAGLRIVDLEKNTIENFSPRGLGQLKMPVNCFVDDKGQLYVADSERGQVVIFDENLRYLNSLGGEENFKPTDVYVYHDKIYVVNVKSHFISVFSEEDQKFLSLFPREEGEGSAKIFQPTNIYVHEQGVFVSDMGDFSVKKYSHEGDFILKTGSYGLNVGQFTRPKGIAVDREENLYVIDAGFENVQVFNNKGQILMNFGGPYAGHGDMYLPAKIVIDYDNLEYFQGLVDKRYKLEYLILVSNQFGPDKINVYGRISLN